MGSRDSSAGVFNRGLFQETLDIALDDDNPARVQQLLLCINTATGIYQDPTSLEEDDETSIAKPRSLLKIAIEAGAFNVAKWQLEEYYGPHFTREIDSSASTTSTAMTPAPAAHAATTSTSNTTRADTPPSSPDQLKTPTTPPSATGSPPHTSINPPTPTPPALAATTAATALSTSPSSMSSSSMASTPTPAATITTRPRPTRPLPTHHHLRAALSTDDALTLPFLRLLHAHEPRLIHARFHDPAPTSALAAARTDNRTDALALAAMDARADVVAWLCAQGADPAASSFAARPLTGWLTAGLSEEPTPGRDGVGLFDRGVARVLLAAGADFGEDQEVVERLCTMSDEVWEEGVRSRGEWDYYGRRPRSGLGKLYSWRGIRGGAAG